MLAVVAQFFNYHELGEFVDRQIEILFWCCELSALGSHFISGVMEPLYFRRNGATGFPALRRHFEPDQGLELSLNN
jgi:hypothetical protein